ncbi:TPA: helix-turn-helix domain-containing protein [Candidatus Woesearchaeota archaeon]|nr:helix-turn-helix domain-containing protein [Candidatus Woesearchaeota archaeon]
MDTDILLQAGLSQREIILYRALIAESEQTASELSKRTGLIRTNVYDLLNTLIKKGIVAYVIRNGMKYFSAAEPEKILDFVDQEKRELDEVKEQLQQMLPQLRPLHLKQERPIIEVYEGKEGLKTILEMSIRESLRTKKEIIGISVQQQKCRELAGPYHIRWYKDREKYNVKSRYLMSAEEAVIPVKYTLFKILPLEAKNPNEIFIFGDVTTQFFFVGDLFTAIVIKNKEITQKYRDYFDFLWGMMIPQRILNY